MLTSSVTVKGQLLIPKRLRDKYGITANAKIIMEETEHGVLIRPMNETYFKSFRGVLKNTGKLKSEWKKMKEEERKLEAEKESITRVKKAK